MTAMQLQLWKRAAFYALALWLVFFAMLTVLILLNLTQRAIPTDVVLLLLAFVVYWTLAAKLHAVSLSQGFFIGVIWLVINIFLDYFIIVKGFNSGDTGFFSAWVIWGRYALLLIIPLVASSRRQVTP